MKYVINKKLFNAAKIDEESNRRPLEINPNQSDFKICLTNEIYVASK
jgi:hypothetical protein